MKYLKNIAQLKLDRNKCTGCGNCTEVCPHSVFSISNGKAEITDIDLCMECSACQNNCPFNALSVRSGVGCATAVISGKLKGTEPACGCSNDPSCC